MVFPLFNEVYIKIYSKTYDILSQNESLKPPNVFIKTSFLYSFCLISKIFLLKMFSQTNNFSYFMHPKTF